LIVALARDTSRSLNVDQLSHAPLNASLDLGKHETQVVPEEREPNEKIVPASFVARIRAESRPVEMA
jgi:hypothetical protein